MPHHPTPRLEESWKTALAPEFASPYFQELATFVREAYGRERVYPPPRYVFRALDTCPLSEVRVVILGQDPYHGPGQANGLAFAVGARTSVPPSLRNIFAEIERDLGVTPDAQNGDLTRWAAQGVLLLNATLTVAAGRPGSHYGKGWERFTDAVVNVINTECRNVVFMLWGANARKKGSAVDRTKHLVLEAPHPSPLSAARGFFGSKHFSQANAYLRAHGKQPIDWR